MVHGDLRTLSPTQLAAMPGWGDKWCELGQCTQPADRTTAERAIAAMYRAARLAPPQVVWCGSPLSLALTRALVFADARELVEWPTASAADTVWISAKAAVEATVALCPSLDDTSLWSVPDDDALLPSLRGPIAQQVQSWIGRPVSSNVWDGSRDTKRVRHADWWQLAATLTVGAPTVAELLRTQIWDKVHSRVWESTWAELPHAVWEVLCNLAEAIYIDSSSKASSAIGALWTNLPSHLISGHDAFGTLAVLDYLRGECGFDLLAEHEAAILLARTAGWALGQERVCWVSERPNVVRRDGQGRLHAGDGPAFAYPDGWRLYFWHGVPVPAEWIEQRARLEPSLALTWGNIEQRRILAEIIGWERVLQQVPSRIIQEADPAIGTLLEFDLPGLGLVRCLRVLCATGRTFVLPVPPECQTALEANAWTYGLQSAEYELEVRT
jgi:hypothetical protein